MLGKGAVLVIVTILTFTDCVCSWALDNVKVTERRSYPVELDTVVVDQRSIDEAEDEPSGGYQDWLQEQVELQRRADDELKAAEIAAAQEEYERIKYDIEHEQQNIYDKVDAKRSSPSAGSAAEREEAKTLGEKSREVKNHEAWMKKTQEKQKHRRNAVTEQKREEEKEEGEMGVIDAFCDDGEHKLEMDWDPDDPANAKDYTCNNSTLRPAHQTFEVKCFEPTRPSHFCMKKALTKETEPPVMGHHRPLWGKYGKYKFIPWQRWLHNLEHGAVGLLYHKCADPTEVAEAEDVLVNCMRKHIITPYDLPPDKPMALVSWGCYLYMTHFDKQTVFNFIKQHSMRGRENSVAGDGQYSRLLEKPAKIVSNMKDDDICPASNFPDMYGHSSTTNQHTRREDTTSHGRTLHTKKRSGINHPANKKLASRNSPVMKERKLERRDANWMADGDVVLVEGNMAPELEKEADIARLEREENVDEVEREAEIARLEHEEDIARLEREAEVAHLERNLDKVKKLFHEKVKPRLHK